MMNRTVKFLLLAVLAITGLNLWAQQVSKGKTDGQADATRKMLLPTVYLGKSEFHGGVIKKEDFNRYLKQGLTSHDSMGNKYKVVSFEFNYVERELFEDSVGNLKVMTEDLFEFCKGDTITSNVAGSIYDRVKAGDTVYIDRVLVAKYLNKNMKSIDTIAIGARGMKCVITK